MKEENTLRFYFLGILLSVLPVMILFRLVFLQFNEKHKNIYLGSLEESLIEARKIIPTRGTIVDRKGHQMAGNERTYEIGIAIDQINDLVSVANVINLATGTPAEEVKVIYEKALNDGLSYVVVEDFVGQDQVNVIEDWMKKASEAKEAREKVSLYGLYARKH